MTEANPAIDAEKPVVDTGNVNEPEKTVEKAAEPAKEGDAAAKAAADTAKTGEVEKAVGDAAKGDEDKGGLPDNWRETAAGKDESLLKMLGRYNSVAALARSLAEKEALIRSGSIKKPMPDPKDEKAMAEWKSAEGIPADATGYKLPEPVMKRLVDEDKPILSAFTEFAAAKNARPEVVEIAAEWYVDMQEKAAEKQTQIDAAAFEDAESELRKEWAHGEYKSNLQLASRWIEGVPGVGKNWGEARLPNGMRLGDVPEFVKFAADMGREKFGDVVFASGDSERKFTARKEEIEKIRDTDIDRYESEGLYKELADINAKAAKRA